MKSVLYNNVDSKINEDEGERKISFVLAIFGDLKKYIFYYKFKDVNDSVEYQIKKMTNCSKISEEIKSELTALKILNYYEWKVTNQDLLKCLSSVQETKNNFIVFDHSDSKNQIPSLVKNTLYKNFINDLIFNIILIKDSNLEQLKNSIILTIHANIKESKFDLSQTQSVIVDLKNLLNPFT
jgi:hypothetical protein